MAEPRVDRLNAEDAPALDAFLERRTDATVFHRPEWHRVIRETYGHVCEYWTARAGGEITGVFPVVTVHVPLLGTKLVAMPYQMGSGYPLAEDAETEQALVEAAVAHARRVGAKYFEIRHFDGAPLLEACGFRPVDAHLVTTCIALERIDLSAIRRNHRRNVRAAHDAGLTIARGRSLEDLRAFRDLYLDEGRRVGAPQAGWDFFENLHRLAPDRYRLYRAVHDGRLIGGLVALTDGRTMFARHSAYSSPEALALNAGAALYWHAIEQAAAEGCETYNCGISWTGDSGLIHWKEGWRGTTVPVRLHVLPLRGAAPVPGSYFEGYRVAKALWRRLPLPLVDRAGRLITRWVA